MEKKAVGKISNAFSTGGGGNNFENQVQAMFLLSLLIDGFCPALNESTKKVCFQTKRLGFDVDDLVIYTSGNPNDKKLHCQIKHSIIVSSSNQIFREVIAGAWSDFKKADFDKNNDQIAIVTAQISSTSQKSLRFLHAQAIGAVDENDFIDRIVQPLYSNQHNKKVLDDIKNCITSADSEPSSTELWEFCKSFILLLFDFDCIESLIRTLTASLIKCNSSKSPFSVWSRLVVYAAECNQNAASINHLNIKPEIKNLFVSKKISNILVVRISEIDLFIPAIAMIGSWREDNENDRNIIEKIAAIGYTEFEAKARNLRVKYPEYIQLSERQWDVIPKEELLEQCKEKFFDKEIERLIDIADMLLSQKSKRVLSDRPYFIPITGEFDNSNELRKSIIKSLCWIKKELYRLPNCNNERINGELSQLVKKHLKDADWVTYASIGDNLRYLAELSPNVFLECIEDGITKRPGDFLALFPKAGTGLFDGTNYITDVLWALEILAWSPEYLASSICILGRLEALSYEKTNWSNTPINSIVSILLPWDSHTSADAIKRNSALACLEKEDKEIYWKVLKRLLPNQTTTNTVSPKPEYLSYQVSKEQVTYSELWKEYDLLLEIAVDTALNETEKLPELICFIEYMSESVLAKYLDGIEQTSESNIDEEQRFIFWFRLKEHLSAIKQTDRIQKLIEKLKPEDIRIRFRELYLGSMYILDKGNYSSKWERKEAEKVLAIKEIYNQYDVEETEKFGRSVNSVYDVAKKLGGFLKYEELSHVINRCFLGLLSVEFTVACITSFLNRKDAEKQLCLALNNLDDEFVLEIISKIPFSTRLLYVVNQLLINDSLYWERAVMPYGIYDDAAEELKIITENLIRCRRYVSAINIIGHSDFESVVEGNTILGLLKLAGTKDSIGNEKIDDYAALKIIGWLHGQECIDLESKSEIDFIYLPLFTDYSEVQPHALNTRLSTDPSFFCSMIEMRYKKRSSENHDSVPNKEVFKRLIRIFLRYKVVPGVDWNGNFSETSFKYWIKNVKEWSKENDRYEITMNKVGTALTYVQLDAERLPDNIIMEELNKVDNSELRDGYYLAMINPWGMSKSVGNLEFNKTEDFINRAEAAERKGYSRYAATLRKITEHFRGKQ